MNDDAPVLVIGAGQAGGELVAALRAARFQGPVTLVGDEPFLPYSRPPLSKAYLVGATTSDELLLRDPSMYEEHDIDVRLGVRAVAIDRDRRVVALEDGTEARYSWLVLATGGRARRLPLPALDAAGNVFHVRTVADVDRLRRLFVAGARLAVVGGGYIGLEVASVARRRGLSVTVLEAEPRVLARVTAPPVSEFFQRVHADEGVDIRLEASVVDVILDASGDVEALLLADGSLVEADVVLVGVGLVPNTELAEAAGLRVEDGIVADEYLRTSDPRVYAIGDVCRHPDPDRAMLRRLESVPNASEQARIVADAIAGRPRPYTSVPWFWSDQYDVKLQVVGLSEAYDDIVIRGDMSAGREFTLLYLRGGAVCAADVANNPRDFAAARKLVAGNAMVDTVRLADMSIPLRELVVR